MSTLDLSLSAPADELPHPPRPEIPLWSENYAFVSYDGAAGVGIFTHIGRVAHNPGLWRGTTAALLPDNKLLISKTVGLAGDRQQPSTNVLTITCQEPFARWRLTHDGSGLATDRDAAARALVGGTDTAELSYDLTFEQMSPVWDLTEWMRQQEWGHAHIEQAGRVRGTVRAAGETYAFDGTGFRDHTLGPRNFANLNRTCWAHAEFPSGRVFCALRIWSPDDHVVLNQGFVYDGAGDLQLLAPDVMPAITSPTGDPSAFAVTFAGHEAAISGEVVHSLPFMLDEPNDLLLGTDLARPATKVIVEAPCRYTWDGEVGFGWLERSRRIDQL